jgi:hypothetical protein
MPYNGELARGYVQSHLVPDSAPQCAVFGLPLEFSELYSFRLHRLPYESSDGSKAFGREELRLEQYELLSVP